MRCELEACCLWRVSRALTLLPAKPWVPPLRCKLGRRSRILRTVLRAGRSRLDLVVNTNVIVTDMVNFPEMNRLFAEYFPENPPARMTLQVPLPKGLLISIGCVAATED